MTGIWIGGAFLASAAFGWRAAAFVGGLVIAAFLIRRRSWLTPLLVVAAAMLGASRSVPPPAVATPSWVDAATAVRGQVDTAPTATGRSQSFRLSVTKVEIDDQWQPARGVICVIAPPLPTAGLGDQVLLSGQAQPLADVPAEARAYLRSRGCEASLFARSISIVEPGSGWRRAFAGFRQRLGGILQRAAPGDSGALLSGLVTGDDHRLTDDRQDAFLRTGTTHITAVSGANMALIVTVLVALGTAGGVRRQLAWQLLLIAAITAYAALVGLEPPVVRAGLVAAGAVLATRFGRRPDLLTLVVLAAVIMVAVEPAQLWSISFQLSFTATVGIIMVAAGEPIASPLDGLRTTLAAILAAQVATLPVLWLIFGELSLTALPANLLIAPLVSVAFPLAALAAGLGLIWEPLATAAALPARLGAELVFGVVDRLGGSSRLVASVGASSPLVALLVAALAAGAILAMSPDVRRGVARLSARTASAFARSLSSK